MSLASAVAASAALILSSPFAAELRSTLRAVLGGGFASTVVIAIGLVTVMAVLGAVLRSGQRRVARGLVLVATIAAAVVYARTFSTGNDEIDAVELLHFLEYGAIAWLFYLHWRPRADPSAILFPMCAGLMVATLDEWLQWFIPSRVGEMRDVALNVVAVGCGLLFSVVAHPPRQMTPTLRLGSTLRAIVFVPLVAGAVGAFVQTAQLARPIAIGSNGLFLSRYSVAELDAAAADRRLRWQTTLPEAAGRFAQEDQYLAEARWHLGRRDRSLDDDEPFVAWREHEVLERFYAPVLGLPEADPRRWTASTREEIARRAGATEHSFVSDAGPVYPLYTWSRTGLWVSTGGVTAFVLIGCCAVTRRTAAPPWV